MLDRVYLALECWVRATPVRLDRFASYIPIRLLRKLADVKLVRTLRHVYRNSPAQRRRWEQAGIVFSDLDSPEVLSRIPFTTGEELAGRPEDFMCVERDELVHHFTSSGSTGVPKDIYFTEEDLAHHADMMGTHFRKFPGSSRVLVMFVTGFEYWAAGSILRWAFERAGMFVQESCASLSPAEQVERIRQLGINVIVTSPSYLHRLTIEMDCDPAGLGIRYIHLASAPFLEKFRREMEKTWNAKIIDAYGSMELGCGTASECVHGNGLHVMEADFRMEIIDPDSGEVLPDGEEGEVAITTLCRVGMPLVRYRTGDLAALIPADGRCACGLPLRKMTRIKKRVDHMVALGAGNNLYPGELEAVLLLVPGVADYQVIIGKEGYKDILNVTVESADGSSRMRERVVEALLSIVSVQIPVEKSRTAEIGKISVVPLGELSRGRPKTRRVIDTRRD